MDGSSTVFVSIVGVIYLIVLIGGYVWYGLALSRLFPLLGAPAWKGWVPIVNEAEILARGGVPGWSVIFFFIPIVQFYGLYLKAVATTRINGIFGRGTGMTVLALLVPPLWATLLVVGRRASAAEPDTEVRPSSRPVAEVRTMVTAPLAAPVVTAIDPDSGMPTAASTVIAPQAVAPTPPPPNRLLAPEPPAPPAAPQPPAPLAAPFVPTPPVGLLSVPEISDPPVLDNPAPATAAPTAAPPPSQCAPGATRPALVEPAAAPHPPIFEVPELDTASASVDVAADEYIDVEEDDDEVAETVIVDRRPVVPWKLHVDGGPVFSLTGEPVVLGRKPDDTGPGIQRIAVPDTTRTLSKVHARLDLDDGLWTVTDLNSTNGVEVIDDDGSARLLPAGGSAEVLESFVLGKVGMRIGFRDEEAGA